MAVFGPVFSRRFGMSLGIDVVSSADRECNFDCLYCELKSSKKVSKIESPEEVGFLLESARKVVQTGASIDVLTVTANGEPTIYKDLEFLIDGLNNIKTSQKTLILSNGSTICDELVRKSLMKFDIVKLSLDSARSESYKKIDRPIGFDLEKTIECMASFSSNFGGELVLETLFVAGVNDSDEDIDALAEAYKTISPIRIDLSSIDRPPAYNVKPIDEQKLFSIAEKIGLRNISVAVRKNAPPLSNSYSKQDWLETLKKRPLTLSDAKFLGDSASYNIFLQLSEEPFVVKKLVAGIEFFALSCD